MRESEAWLLQVDSDFFAADRIMDRENAITYCQAMSKFQQVVEKSINAIDAVLREKGTIQGRARAEHYPERMLNRLARLPTANMNEIEDRITTLLRRHWAEIYNLCMLDPHLPMPGELYAKNTEYPFNLADGSWTAPAANDSFTLRDIERYRKLAETMRSQTKRIVTGAYRGI